MTGIVAITRMLGHVTLPVRLVGKLQSALVAHKRLNTLTNEKGEKTKLVKFTLLNKLKDRANMMF